MKPVKIINGRMITPRGILPGASVLVRAGRIAAVEPGDIPAEDATVIDAGGLYVSPGFVDIHLHGAGGHDFMDGTAEAFHGAAAALPKHGTTAIVPTSLAASHEELLAMISAFHGAVATQRGARLLGLHLEGPYFSQAQRGAQDPRFIKPPCPAEYRQIAASCQGILRWSAAPELPGALEFGKTLREYGILPCVAHTDATAEQVAEAFASGYTHMTHLYSGMQGVRRIDGMRVAGAVEAAFLLDGMTVEIIADGMHLPASLLKLVYKIKGPDRIALITDSMRAAGTDDTASLLGSLRDGQPVLVEGGVAWLPDHTAFAGSVATCDRLVRNMIELAEVPLADAVKMMTLTPARIIGADRELGSIEVGKLADLTLFDERIGVKLTLRGGEVLFRAGEKECQTQ